MEYQKHNQKKPDMQGDKTTGNANQHKWQIMETDL